MILFKKESFVVEIIEKNSIKLKEDRGEAAFIRNLQLHTPMYALQAKKDSLPLINTKRKARLTGNTWIKLQSKLLALGGRPSDSTGEDLVL